MGFINPVESMVIAKKWLSMGAAAAGILVPLGVMFIDCGLNLDLFLLFFTALLIILAMAGAAAGADILCRIGPRGLNEFPPSLLVALGFILSPLIAAIGLACLFLRIVLAGPLFAFF